MSPFHSILNGLISTGEGKGEKPQERDEVPLVVSGCALTANDRPRAMTSPQPAWGGEGMKEWRKKKPNQPCQEFYKS